jgi:hypothetical protein
MSKEKKSTVATAMQLEDLSKEELIQVYREQMGMREQLKEELKKAQESTANLVGAQGVYQSSLVCPGQVRGGVCSD